MMPSLKGLYVHPALVHVGSHDIWIHSLNDTIRDHYDTVINCKMIAKQGTKLELQPRLSKIPREPVTVVKLYAEVPVGDITIRIFLEYDPKKVVEYVGFNHEWKEKQSGL